MSRLILAFLAALFLPGTALAACPGVMADCPAGSNTRAEIAPIGLKADGVTSDDVALKALVDQCAANGGKLVLPAGKIVLSGAATITLRNCHLEGTGVPAGFAGSAGSMGTTFVIKSTTVKPFVCGDNWRISGVNFWYPDQVTGLTVYPPTISDDGVNQCHTMMMDHFIVVNAYDFVKQSPIMSWERLQVSEANIYAVHSAFDLNLTGDSFAFTGVNFTSIPWFDIDPTNSRPAINAAIQSADGNAIFRVTSDGAANPGVTVNVYSSEAFAWRYGVKVENGGVIEGSIFDVNWDGIGTLIDASAAVSPSGWAINNVFRGFGVRCQISVLGGGGNLPSTCFNMGPSDLVLDHFSAASSGDFFNAAGGSLTMTGGQIGGIGLLDTGNDHYIARNVGGGSNGHVVIRDAYFGYSATSSAHNHGINTNNFTDIVVQNNNFINFNDIVAGPYTGTMTITGNESRQDFATAIVLTPVGPTAVVYSNNTWNKPPLATVSACGSGATITGSLSGLINVGAGAGTTCTVTTPLIIKGASCQFGINLQVLNATTSLSNPPQIWRFDAASDISSKQMTYFCAGSQ